MKKYPGIVFVWAVCILLLFVATCVVRQSGVNQPRQPSAYEQVLAANAVLANINKSFAQGVIALNQTTPPLLSAETAHTFVNVSERIADLDKRLTLILAKGQEAAKADSASIQALIAEIESTAQGAVNSGALGVKNPQSQQTLQAEVALVSAMAKQLVVLLKVAGVLQ